MFCYAYFQLLAALEKLQEAVDIAEGNVTDMATMIPMVREQFEKNQEQLDITEHNATNAHEESQAAEKVCGIFSVKGRVSQVCVCASYESA